MVNTCIKFHVTVLANIVFGNKNKCECVVEKHRCLGCVKGSNFDIVF